MQKFKKPVHTICTGFFDGGIMRVLHVISDNNIGGAGILLLSLLRNFEKERIENAVALPNGSALTERVAQLGIPTFSLQHSPDRVSAASLKELKRVMLIAGPDIVHTNAALSARVCAKLCHITVFHTRHCCFPPSGIWKNPLVRSFGGIWNRALSDCAIATAEVAKENLKLYGIPQNKIHVVLNGSEPIRTLDEDELQSVRKRYGFSKEDFTIGICARLVSCKGHRVFLMAAKRLLEMAPLIPFRFLIVGEGEERLSLEAFAKELGIFDRVIFTGFVEDMATVYRVLRVNVNCSWGTETSCLALSEGMSASLPCVVSDYGGNRAMIGDSLAGFVYPTGDYEMLANLLLKIATNQNLELQMKKAAYERYLQCYTARGMADRVDALYHSVLSQNRKNRGRKKPLFLH